MRLASVESAPCLVREEAFLHGGCGTNTNLGGFGLLCSPSITSRHALSHV